MKRLLFYLLTILACCAALNLAAAPKKVHHYIVAPSGSLPGIAVDVRSGAIRWASTGYEVGLTDDLNNAVPGFVGDLPPTSSGWEAIPAGTYIVYARGERGLTVRVWVEVP